MVYILEHLQSRADSFACALIIFIKNRQKITFPSQNRFHPSKKTKLLIISLFQEIIIQRGIYKQVMATRSVYYLKQEGYQLDRCCFVCYQVDYQMIQCTGFCRKLACKTCFDKMANQTCPICKYQTAKQYVFLEKPLYNCPSKEPWKCQSQIRSAKQLEQHALLCQLVQASTRDQFQQKKDFKCKNNHLLTFSHQKRTCCECFLYKQSSICNTCKEAYCNQCRNIPCSKKECPIGHQLRLLKDHGGITCDICGIAVRKFIDRYVYTDRACNFDICVACAKDLPEEHPLPSFKQPQQREIESQSDNQIQYD